MDKGTRERQLLFHTSGKGSGLAFFKWFYLRINILNCFIIILKSSPEEGREKIDILPDAQILIEGKLSRHITDPLTYLLVVLYYIITTYRSCSRIRQQKSGQYPEQGGLSGTIRTDKPKEFPFIDTQRYPLQGTDLPGITFYNIFSDNCKHQRNFTSPYIPIFT